MRTIPSSLPDTSFLLTPGLDYSNWLELIITNIQVLIIQLLSRYYLSQHRNLLLTILFKTTTTVLLASTPLEYLQILLKCIFPIMIFNKITTTWQHYKTKSTGAMSGATLAMQCFQFSGRCFTAVMSGASEFIAPSAINAFFAFIYLFQFWVYGGGKVLKAE
eukprot:sb/3472786/